MKRVALLVMAALLATAALWWHGQQLLLQPLRLDGERFLQVERGDALQPVLARLAADGVLDGPRRVVWSARLRGRELGIKAGEYRLHGGMRVTELIDTLVAGRTVLHGMTIVEGWTFLQLRRALADHPALRQTLQGVDGAGLMALLGRPGRHPEGWFFPETYLFERGASDLEFLERALAAMEAHLADAWAERDGGLPYDDPYEALILASLVEREAAIRDERPVIAGVFVRRLQRGMRLQTDPSVMYGLGPAFEGRLRAVHLRTDTPYNTYTRHGLPPTPIAMPGASAIDAAVRPAAGDALYFVSRGDGSHHFSATLEEHNRAVERYILGRGGNGNGTQR